MPRSLSMAQAIRQTLAEAMERDPTTLVIGESVGRSGGVAGSTAGLLDQFGPERVRDLPIADRGAVGLGVGLALAGATVVIELSGPGRLLACLEVLADAAHTAETTEFPVPVVLRVPAGREAGAAIDRATAGVLGGIPGLAVACASDSGTAAGLLASALRRRGPTVLFEPRSLYTRRSGVGGDVALDKARVLATGDHVTLAAWGNGVHAALAAASSLTAEGISADVVDVVSLAPIDAATLGERVRHTGRLVVVGDDDVPVERALLAAAIHQAFWYLESPLAAASGGADAVARAARNAIAT